MWVSGDGSIPKLLRGNAPGDVPARSGDRSGVRRLLRLIGRRDLRSAATTEESPRYAGSAVRAPDLQRLDPGAGPAGGADRGPGDRADGAAADGANAPVGRGGPHADGVGDRGEQHGCGLRVTVRARGELVHAKLARVGGNPRPEPPPRRPRAAPGLDDGN